MLHLNKNPVCESYRNNSQFSEVLRPDSFHKLTTQLIQRPVVANINKQSSQISLMCNLYCRFVCRGGTCPMIIMKGKNSRQKKRFWQKKRNEAGSVALKATTRNWKISPPTLSWERGGRYSPIISLAISPDVTSDQIRTQAPSSPAMMI